MQQPNTTRTAVPNLSLPSDWASYLLGPQAALTIYPYLRQGLSLALTAKSYMLPLLDQISQKPDLATIALLLVILFISLKILNMLYQTVIFWFRMARRIAFWGGLVALALWMYTRGPDGVAADMQYWYATWNGEYQYWKDQERVARMTHQKPAAGRRGAGW